MSGSYTNIFGSQVTAAAYQSLIIYQLTALVPQIQLSWPTQFVDSANYASNIIQVTATQAGTSFVMPPANIVSIGQANLFVNLSAYSIIVYANDASTIIFTLTANSATYLYLNNNTTTNGTWQTTPWGTGGGGGGTVTSVAAVSTSTSLTITGSPITNNGTFTFSLTGNIGPIDMLSGTGYLARTGVDTWALRTYSGTVNQITISNPAGIAGNSVWALAANVSGITSLTAGNIEIGVNGTNVISTLDTNPVIYASGISLANEALTFFDSTGTGYAAFQSPAGDYSSNVTYTLPSAPPGTNGYQLASTTLGVLSWAAPSAGAVSSVSGTAGRIDVSPTTGACVVNIDPAYIGQGSITTVGTIGTGIWNGSVIQVPFGGTGNASTIEYGLITGGTTNTGALQNAGTGNATQLYQSTGSTSLGNWVNSSSVGGVQLIASVGLDGMGLATANFNNLNSNFWAYKIIGVAIQPVTNDVNLLLRVSTNNGASYITAADYSWVNQQLLENSSSPQVTQSTSDTSIQIIPALTNGNSCYFELMYINPVARLFGGPYWQGRCNTNSNGFISIIGEGTVNASPVTAFQFLLSSGNFNTGAFILYGYST